MWRDAADSDSRLTIVGGANEGRACRRNWRQRGTSKKSRSVDIADELPGLSPTS